MRIVQTLNTKVVQRARHEPLAYIRHKTEFYGRKFYIDRHVLEPRPESETMIDLLKQLPLPTRPSIADIGTGSGALAITAALELPAEVWATDIDKRCLKVAARNAAAHNTKINLLQGDLVAPLIEHDVQPRLLLCNLPYVPDDFHINPAAMREPRLAIFGGPDGLDLYRKLFKQLNSYKLYPEYILAEAMPSQHDSLCEIAKTIGYKPTARQDFILLLTRVSRR